MHACCVGSLGVGTSVGLIQSGVFMARICWKSTLLAPQICACACCLSALAPAVQLAVGTCQQKPVVSLKEDLCNPFAAHISRMPGAP